MSKKPASSSFDLFASYMKGIYGLAFAALFFMVLLFLAPGKVTSVDTMPVLSACILICLGVLIYFMLPALLQDKKVGLSELVLAIGTIIFCAGYLILLVAYELNNSLTFIVLGVALNLVFGLWILSKWRVFKLDDKKVACIVFGLTLILGLLSLEEYYIQNLQTVNVWTKVQLGVLIVYQYSWRLNQEKKQGSIKKINK